MARSAGSWASSRLKTHTFTSASPKESGSFASAGSINPGSPHGVSSENARPASADARPREPSRFDHPCFRFHSAKGAASCWNDDDRQTRKQ